MQQQQCSHGKGEHWNDGCFINAGSFPLLLECKHKRKKGLLMQEIDNFRDAKGNFNSTVAAFSCY